MTKLVAAMLPGSRWIAVAPLVAIAMFSAGTAWGQLNFTESPINYIAAEPNDAVQQLQRRLDRGEVQLQFDDQSGYLRSALDLLQLPVSSQCLVYSKTSLQVRHISPRTPRAVYFNEGVYLGWVQGGHIEISAVDPVLGANFYTLSQQQSNPPRFVRQTFDCLQCHGSVLTRGVPGHMVRSVFTGPDGHFQLDSPSYLSDHSSPLHQRWGGWYVTGKHGTQRHLGNLFVRKSDDLKSLDLERGANIADLHAWIDAGKYLSPSSDIVALLVLEHQTNMQNRLTRANFLTRIALQEDRAINGDPDANFESLSEQTRQQIREAATPVVEHLLFAGEIELTDTIEGKSGFAQEFASHGPRDARGRSLRDFDLRRRMFKYPASYLIYSELFENLPAPVRVEIYRQLWDVLTHKNTERKFAQLSREDRTAIREIVRDTKQGLPEYWTTIVDD